MILAILRMALRSIARNAMRSMLTALGIVIGVASVIAMVTLGRGATAKVTSDVAAMGNNLLIVMPGADRRGPATTNAQAFTLDDVRAISREVTAVSSVAPTASKNAMVVEGDKNWNTSVTGTTNSLLEIRGYTIARGESFSEADLSGGASVCILGQTVVKQLFGHQEAVGGQVRIGSIACDVVGVLASKGQAAMGQDQDDVVLMPLRTVQRRLTGSKDVTAIFLSAKNDRDIAHAKAQVEGVLRERRRIQPGQTDDFNVMDVKEIANTLGSVTKTLTALLAGIAAVSLLVGGIGIMNIMLVSVTERTREIGLRMAIGALREEVLLQFLVEAVVLAVLGGVLGTIVGLIASYGATVAFHMPLVMRTDVVAIGFVFSILVGVLFGFLPARRAAQLRPIDALRHE